MGDPGTVTACPKCGADAEGEARFCGKCGAALSSTQPNSEPEDASGEQMIGRDIAGRYRILAKLGEGGMGAVYRAEQISLKRQVGLKVLKAELSRDPGLVRRFNAEAELAAKLTHPNTVTLFDFGQDPDLGLLFIAMELLEGRSLRRVIVEGGPLIPARALAIAEQVCASLADAHANRITHRDLKPDNIMLIRRGKERDVVRVLDFGIAKLRDQGGVTAMPMTQAGDLIGTPQYMAPEQIRGESVDGRTDVYALGAVLYEMITGRLPFEAPTLMAILSKHLTEPPVPPAERRADLSIPPELDSLIVACLAKDPAQRPQEMEALGQHLAELRQRIGPAPPRPDPTPPPIGNAAVPALSSPPPSGSNYPGAMSSPPPGVPRRLTPVPGLTGPGPTPMPGGGAFHHAAPTPAGARPAGASPEIPVSARAKEPRGGRGWLLVAALLLVAGGGVGTYFAVAGGEKDGGGEERADGEGEGEEGLGDDGDADGDGDGKEVSGGSMEPGVLGEGAFPAGLEGKSWSSPYLGYRFRIPPGFRRATRAGSAVEEFRGQAGGRDATIKLFAVPLEGATTPDRATVEGIGRAFIEQELGGRAEHSKALELGGGRAWTGFVNLGGGRRRAQVVAYPSSVMVLVAALIADDEAFEDSAELRRELFGERLRLP